MTLALGRNALGLIDVIVEEARPVSPMQSRTKRAFIMGRIGSVTPNDTGMVFLCPVRTLAPISRELR